MATVSVAHRWSVVRQKFSSVAEGKQVENLTISSDVSAELCIRLLSSSCLQNFSGLRAKIQTSSAEWITEFLSRGGLEILFQALKRLSKGEKMAFMEACMQLECVNCIKAVMNSKRGLDSMIRNKTLVRNLAKGWRLISIVYFFTEISNKFILRANDFQIAYWLIQITRQRKKVLIEFFSYFLETSVFLKS